MCKLYGRAAIVSAEITKVRQRFPVTSTSLRFASSMLLLGEPMHQQAKAARQSYGIKTLESLETRLKLPNNDKYILTNDKE